MSIIGFNFRKITAERIITASGKINVSNNVALKKVEEASIPVGTGSQKSLRFSYEFITKYEPKVGSIIIEGDLLFLAPDDVVEDTLKKWKKTKNIDKTILSPILNTILSKCSVKSLLLSQDLSLPSPLEMPQVTVR